MRKNLERDPEPGKNGGGFGLAAALLLCLTGCGGEQAAINVGVSTSVHDSGLLTAMKESFEAANPGYSLRVIAAGSGQLLSLGARGDLDVLITHSPAAELRFIEAGHGVRREPIMENDFVIVGPPADPARIRGTSDVVAALAKIAHSGAAFMSRGDESGTHRKEQELWRAAGIAPGGWSYSQLGQGMGAVLNAASETRSYTLADRGTYLFMRRALELDILVEGDERLRNVYSVIIVTEPRERVGAELFVAWVTSEPARSVISEYGRKEFGAPLFKPYAELAVAGGGS